jgi:hypothetical protein
MQSIKRSSRPGRPGEPGNFAGHQGEHPAWPGVALPWPELRAPEHQDGAPDNRPLGRRGRDPGGFAQA